MIRPDVLIEIHFDMNQPEKTVIKTNAKKEALGEILATWLQNQISLGKDDSKPNMKDKFLIKIGLRIEDDTFGLESDTGGRWSDLRNSDGCISQTRRA